VLLLLAIFLAFLFSQCFSCHFICSLAQPARI
jgi:hypothetical protein